MQVREKVGKSRNTLFFQSFVAPEGRKVGSLKWQVRSHVVRWEMKKCKRLWREAHPSQNVQNNQNTPCSDHFWKLRCRKRIRHCGVKHISKSKVENTAGFRSTFGRSERGRRKGFCTLPKVSKTWRFCGSFNYNHHYTTLHYATLHYTTLHNTTLHYTTLLYATTASTTTTITTPLHTTLITLHYTNYITLHYTPLHYTTLHYTAVHSIKPHYTTSTTTTTAATTITTRYTTIRYATLHHTPLHSTPLRSAPLHSTPTTTTTT